jgi:hypothetical protein
VLPGTHRALSSYVHQDYRDKGYFTNSSEGGKGPFRNGMADATFEDWGLARAVAIILNAAHEGRLILATDDAAALAACRT